MNSKSKTFIAVFAVIIMLGGALVPLTYPSSDAIVEEQSTDDGTSDFSLATIIEKIREKGKELINEIDLGNGTFLLPIDQEVTATKVIPSQVNTVFTIEMGDVAVLGDGVTKSYSFNWGTTEGRIQVKAGGALVLFPAANGDYGFEIFHSDTCGEMPLIEMEDKSILNIFGKSFVVRVDDTKNADGVLHLLMLYKESKVFEKEKGVKATFMYKYNNGNVAFGITVNEKAKLIIANTLVLCYNPYKEKVGELPAAHPDILFTGTMSGDKTAISLSGFVLIDVRESSTKMGNKLFQGHFDIDSATIDLTANIQSLDNWKISGTIDVSISGIYMEVYNLVSKSTSDSDAEKVLFAVVYNGTVKTGNITATVSFAKSDIIAHKTVNASVSLTKETDLVIAADKILIVDFNIVRPGNEGFKNLQISDISLRIGNTSCSVSYMSATEQRNLKMDADTSVSFTVGQVALLNYSYKSDGKEPELVSKILVNDIALTLGETKISGGCSYDSASVTFDGLKISTSASLSINNGAIVMNVDKDNEKSVTLAKGLSLTLQSINVTLNNNKNGSVSIGEISVKGTVSKNLITIVLQAKLPSIYEMIGSFSHDVTLDARLYNVEAILIQGNVDVTGNLDVQVKVKHDGRERVLEINLEDIQASGPMDDLDVMKIGKVHVKNDISIAVFEKILPEFIKEYVPQIGLGSLEFEASANNLCYDSENEKITADSMSLSLKNGIKFKEFSINFNDNLVLKAGSEERSVFYFMGLTVQCGNIHGSIVNYKGDKNDFSVTDNPQLGLGISLIPIPFLISTTIVIDSGKARFDGGKIPFSIFVGKNAKFSADGLTATNFFFEPGCDISGTVVIDTGLRTMMSLSDISVLYADGYSISVKNSMDEGATSSGYKVIIDLKDIYNGKIEANKGNELPRNYSNDTGFSMKSDDGITGTYSITKVDDYTLIDLQCEKKLYTVSYADDYVAAEKYRYGEWVEITSKVPSKEGYDFLGWTDGTGALYNYDTDYDGFEMPARDVVLKPVFTKTAQPDVVMEGEDKTLVVDATDVPLVNVEITEKNWTKITIKTANTSVTFSKETYDAMTEVEEGEPAKYILFGCIKADNIDNEDVAEMVGNKELYSMKLYLLDSEGQLMEEPNYDGDTMFQVTVNVHTDKNVKDFKVHYINEYGYTEEIGVDSYKVCADGSYDVTFTVNHFSLYAVEPIYQNTVDNLFILVGLIVLIVVICALLAVAFSRKSKA